MNRSLSPSLLAWARAFDAAARHSSFTRAADELGISQGAVSQQVRRLEELIGTPLFVRRPQTLELTPEGRRIAPVLAEAFASIRNVLTETGAPAGFVPVTLSCSPSFALRWLNSRLAGLSARAPKVDLRVFGEFHPLDRQRMRAEGLEAAIRYDAGDYGDLVAELFLDEWLMPVASPAFLDAHSEVVGADELDGRMLLHDMRPWHGASEDAEWRGFAEVVGIAVRHAAQGKRFNLSQLAIDAALAGEGIAVGRLALVLEDLEAGRLVPAVRVAVRSGGAYRFISHRDRPPRISAIASWLQGEGRAFAERRDRYLAASSVTRVD